MGGSKCRSPSTLDGKSVGGADSLPSNRPACVQSSSVFNHLARILFQCAVGGRIATFLRGQKTVTCLTWGARIVSNPAKLRNEFLGTRGTSSCLEIEARMPSEVKAISPLVDRLIRLIEESRCISGKEFSVELALREALNNAVLHGNRLDPGKLVYVYCRCELGKGVSVVVKDQGKGFDPCAIPDPLAAENLMVENGRGILLMRSQMDEVSFERGGTEIHMRKSCTQ
jgi:serine/threonine-protein kinase RsbW